ncbi:MAG: hypothetical protein ACRDQG_04750, partial [Pseudonocardiaceae bacterium]
MTMTQTSSSMLSSARRSGARVLVALGLVATLGVAAGCGGEPPPPPTGRVERGAVVTKVSASGSLSAIREQNLGFPKGAQLKQLVVKVGDRVTAGQIVAQEDDFAFRQTLAQLQGQLNSQRALFGKFVADPTVQGAQATLDQAHEILEATQKSIDAELAADQSATDQAHKQLDFDSYLQDKAQETLRADQVSCSATGGIPFTPPAPANGVGGTGGPNSSVGVGPAQAGVDDPARVGPVFAGSTGSGGSGTAGSGGSGNPACNRIPTDQQAVLNARRTVMTDKTTLQADQQKENVDRAQGLVSIENARQSVVTAQNTVDSAAADRP